MSYKYVCSSCGDRFSQSEPVVGRFPVCWSCAALEAADRPGDTDESDEFREQEAQRDADRLEADFERNTYPHD